MKQIDVDELESFVRALVVEFDAEEAVAAAVAESLVGAGLVEHGSHGSIRMGTLYREMVESGKIEQLEAEKTRLDDRIADKRTELDGKKAEIETEIDCLHDHKQTLESTINQLQRILQFNEDHFDGGNPELHAALGDREAAAAGVDCEALTDQLVEDITVCWTCESERDAIEFGTTIRSMSCFCPTTNSTFRLPTFTSNACAGFRSPSAEKKAVK